MTEKSKLLSLMAHKEKLAVSKAAQEFGRLSRQKNQNDAYAEQLKSMMETQGDRQENERVITKAQLTSDHWFGAQIAAQLEQVHAKSQEMKNQMSQALNHLAHVEARASNYTQKAQSQRHQERAIKAEHHLNQIIDADL